MIVLGNKELLDQKLAVVLNSSQSKTPCGNDHWIRKTSQAIKQLIENGYTIITSTGISTWELSIFLTNAAKGNQIIISPVYDEADGEIIFEKTLMDFNLNPQNTAMIFVKPEGSLRSPKNNWLKRDRAAISLAHKIAPISIRPGGRLQGLLEDDSARNKCLNDFRIEYEKPLAGPTHYEFNSIKDYTGWNYLTHWTKTCFGPWPGENKAAFYEKLISSEDTYPTNAFNTIHNIILERKLRASGNKMREGRRAIGFSEENPGQMITKIMRWCPRHVNWNFEPYGVAIEKETAISLGMRPVIYGDESDYNKLTESDRPYFQSLGKAEVDWRVEREWRFIGALDLRLIPSDKIIFLVFREREALLLKREVSERVMALEN